MEKENIMTVDIEDFKKSQHILDYIDDDFAIVNSLDGIPYSNDTVRLNCFLIAVCAEGCIQLDINYRTYQLQAGDLLLGLPNTLISRTMLSPKYKIRLAGFSKLSFTEYNRLAACFPETEVLPCGTALIRKARSVKTEIEIEMFRRSGIAHAKAYEQIPSVYRPGMTDRQLSIEIERLMRLEGCLGIFRTFGQSMEIFMGSLLAGDNATAPAPYDFALGGEGLDPSLPISVNGALLQPGQSFMVDMGGNFYGYMGDMSRVFSIGKLPEKAYVAHQVCLDIQEAVVEKAKPGAVCEDLYNLAIDIVTKAGFADNFMGATQKAKFIGHGIGLEINEMPVLAPRMKQELEPGMVFALEPKIVLPGIGPVGIENSWVITAEGVEKLTLCKEEIVEL